MKRMMKMRQKHILLPASAVLLVLIAVGSVCVGSYPLSIEQICSILTGGIQDSMESRVFWNIRLPRVVMGLLSGGVLGLAGSIYQTIFRNSLASPDLTGVASGASFGAACAIVFGTGSGLQIMTGSFLVGILSLIFVLLLVSVSGIEKTGSYILSGIIVSSLADAGIMLLKFTADPEQELAAIEFWTMGSLASMTSQKLFPQIFCIVIPMIMLLGFRRQVIILSLGGEHAKSVGLSPRVWRMILLGLSTLMVAAVVSVTGVIAFVGLIAPHIAFLLYRRRNGSYFVLCVLFGGIILLAADILARSLYGGAELPLSILTVLLSVPMLILLLSGRKGVRNESDF